MEPPPEPAAAGEPGLTPAPSGAAEATTAASSVAPPPPVEAAPQPAAPPPAEAAPQPAAPPPAEAAPPGAGEAPAAAAARPRARRGPLRARLHTEGQLQARGLRVLQVLAVLLLVAGVVWLLRAPILRPLARGEGGVSAWAAGELLEMRDPGSFDVYVLHLGREGDHTGFASLLYELAGRSSLAPAEQLDVAAPPEEPAQVEAHGQALLAALDHTDPAMRRGAVYALLMLKDRPWTRGDALLERVAARLEDGDDVVRRRAALVLAAGEPPAAAIPALIRAAHLPEDDSRVRKFAVRALGQTRDPRGQQALLQALEDPTQEVRDEAALALVARDQEVPLDELAGLLRRGQPEQRAEVLQALARSGTPEATALLIEALDESTPDARLAAVGALAQRPGADVRAALEKSLADEADRVRLAAAVALGARTDGVEALPALLSALEHALERQRGWNELLELHRALRAHTGAEIEPPTPAPDSWAPTVEAWRARLGSPR